MKIKNIIIWFLIYTASYSYPQNEKINETLNKIFDLANKGASKLNLLYLIEAEEKLKEIESENQSNGRVKYLILYVDYRRLNFDYIKSKINSKILNRALERSTDLLKYDPSNENKLIASAIYLMKASNSGLSAPFYASKANSLIEEVLNADASNPRAYLLKGIYLYNLPLFLGGGVKKAKKSFYDAIKLFDKNSADWNNEDFYNWGKIEAYAWLGDCFLKEGDKESAKRIFDEGLRLDPEFSWIKDFLYPLLAK